MYDTDNIRRVWMRVTGDPAEVSGSERERTAEERLREYIADERAASDTYDSLASKISCRSYAAVLRGIAQDERRHERFLQTEYFILTGDTFSPEREKPSGRPITERLREAYVGELAAAEGYEREAANAGWNEKQRCTFRNMAGDERGHSEKLREIIEKLMA